MEKLRGSGMFSVENFVRAGALAVVVATVVACGGGGSDAGTSPFGAESPASGVAGNAPGGGITVVSNRVASQKYMSIAVGTYNQDWSFDGQTTQLTVRVADSAGNPVPEGTVVQFSTEGGQIQKSCRLTGSTNVSSTLSVCQVEFGTQELRPLDGLVGVVAWLEGEEAYGDLNGNGRYDAGEPFYDAGKLFRDDDSNGAYTASVDEINVGGTVVTPELGIGTSSCALPADRFLNDEPMSVTGTCDGKWGNSLVRANVTLAVSDPRYLGGAKRSNPDTQRDALLVFSTFGSREVAAPLGTNVSTLTAPAGCSVTLSPSSVPNSARPSWHTVTSVGTCAGTARFKITFGSYEQIVDYPL